MQYNTKLKFVEKENLHISLKFLGDLNSLEIEKINNILQDIFCEQDQFSINLSENLGLFPGTLNPRILWIGINKGNETILELNQLINNKLKSEPFYKNDKNFVPHVTLARIKYIKYTSKFYDSIKDLKINPIADIIKRIDLMESKLSIQGPTYKTISNISLNKSK